jgi:uncharacterized protein YecT (DUF1311 family)
MRNLTLLALLIIGGQAQAQSGGRPVIHYSDRFQACSDRAGGSYTHIINCESQEQGFQEMRLNQAYVRIMQGLTPDRKIILRKSERQWLVERDKKCPLVTSDIGLSEVVDRNLCRLDETVRRIIWLEHY